MKQRNKFGTRVPLYLNTVYNHSFSRQNAIKHYQKYNYRHHKI